MAGLANGLRASCVAALMMALSACSSDSSDDSETPCNALLDDGPLIAVTMIAANAPAPSGGTIADGTYELDAMTIYTGPGGSTDVPAGNFSAVFEFSGNTIQQVGHINGAESRYTSTYTIAGTTISTVDSCPQSSSSSHSFSASPTEVSISDSESVGTVQQTYRKR